MNPVLEWLVGVTLLVCAVVMLAGFGIAVVRTVRELRR